MTRDVDCAKNQVVLSCRLNVIISKLMSFIHPKRETNSTPSQYILTIVLVLVAYVFVGQIPLGIAWTMAEHQSVDLIKTIQESVGLTATLFILIFPLLMVFVALFVAVKYIHKWKMLSVFNNRSKIDFKRILASFFVWFVISLLIMVVGFNDAFIWNFQSEKFFPLALLSLLIIPIQCAAEELLFRGYLFQAFGTKIKQAWVVVLISGGIFGLLHISNPEIGQLGNSALIYYIWSGFFLGFLTVLDDGLEIPLGYHIANNLFATLIVTNDWQAFTTDALYIDQNPPSFTIEMMVILLLGQLVFAGLFSKLYRWKFSVLKK